MKNKFRPTRAEVSRSLHALGVLSGQITEPPKTRPRRQEQIEGQITIYNYLKGETYENKSKPNR